MSYKTPGTKFDEKHIDNKGSANKYGHYKRDKSPKRVTCLKDESDKNITKYNLFALENNNANKNIINKYEKTYENFNNGGDI